MNDGDPSAPRHGGDRVARRWPGGRLRLRAWPYEPAVGVVLPADHQAVPSAGDVHIALDAARRHGFVTLRTGALFPRAAAMFAEAGFRTIDTLALLEVRLDAAVVPDVHGRTRPLRRWHHAAAAGVDLRAFGAPWGNDTATLAEIRAATPVHRARRVDIDGETVAFCISGAAGRTGYLQRLAVDPTRQRHGLASLLVTDALRWMQQRGLADAVVNTGVSNVAALTLYERFGFRRRPEVLVIAERAVEPAADAGPDGALGAIVDDVADAGR